MGIAIFLIAIWVLSWTVIKAYEFYKVKKNKKWSDEPIEHIDMWEYPSNIYRRRKK